VRIGIPKALIYYYYYPLWKTFFEELGFEVVLSDDTSKEIIDKGIKISVQEICVPIKVFNSHVLNLIEKGVDYIFIPRMVSIKKNQTFCPKFLGLPDMSRVIFKEYSDKIISPHIISKSNRISNLSSYLEVGRVLNIPKPKLKKALKNAAAKWDEFRTKCYQGHSINDILADNLDSKPSNLNLDKSTVNIGLMGYVYNIYDNFISMDIISKLRNMGINVITFEMLPEDELFKQLSHLRKPLFWTFSNYLLGAGYYFLNNENIDGIIHVTAFGCGPDSYIGKMMELESDKKKKPFLTMRVDEHTGESHLVTRLEAFTDMLIRKKIAFEGRKTV